MYDYDTDRFVENFDEIKKSFFDTVVKCHIYESAMAAQDSWAVPDIESKEGQFAYVPLNVDNMIEILVELDQVLMNEPGFKHTDQKYRPFSFLEIGCGIGRNVNLVGRQEHLPVAKAVGFDIVPEYIERAKQIYGLGENVFVGDCMKQGYSGYDVIFFYRPFSDDDKEIAFERYLLGSMRTGSIVIGASSLYLEDSREAMALGESFQIFKKL